MNRTTTLTTLLLSIALAACVADPADYDGNDERSDDAEESTPIRIVPVIADQATEEWAAAQPSIHDGQPIGVPAPDKRFREVFGLLSDQLAVGGSLTTMYAYSFGVDESAATRGLGEAFTSYGAPIVLLDSSNPDPGVYGGSNRTTAHGDAVQEAIGTPGGGGVTVSLGRFGVPVSRELPSAAVVTFAGALEASGLDREEAVARAKAVEACVQEEFVTGLTIQGETATPSQSEQAIAIAAEVIEAPVSALEILEGNTELIKDAIVIVGNSQTLDYLRDGNPQPFAVGHAWAIAALVNASASCK